LKRLVLVLLAALAVAVPAQAAPPPVHAKAWLVEDAATGEVLASSQSHEELPIASTTIT
jgi:D-alanyl-D-alanine carboxypeptidase